MPKNRVITPLDWILAGILLAGACAAGYAIATRLGRMPLDEAETFAELRRWKDGFRA